jgi:hypothetical protein
VNLQNVLENNIYKNIALITLFIICILSIGYIFGLKSTDNDQNDVGEPTTITVENGNSADPAANVKNLVSYSLPDGWSETTCPSVLGSVHFQPSSAPKTDCGDIPELRIKLSVISGNITECSQIQDVKEVKKHICKSLYINDLRSLKAETEYLDSSVYGRSTNVQTYYIDSGSGIIKAEYIHAESGIYQSEFDELTSSIKAI